MGRFVVFEGGEGSGKSTQARRLAARWGADFTFEPGDTEVGGQLRELLLSHATGDLDPRTEALLMAADRAEHVATVILPALERGRDVICDRYLWSSVAYQGYGRGLDPNEVYDLSMFAADGLVPDLVVLLDVAPEVAAERLAAAGDPDRFEAAGDDFHARVVAGYRAMAEADPSRWLVVDGTGTIDEVGSRVDAAVDERLPDPLLRP